MLLTDLPGIPKNFTVKSKSQDFIILNWEKPLPPGDYTPETTHYKLEIIDNNHGGNRSELVTLDAAQYQYTVDSLATYSNYTFRLLTVNVDGSGTASELNVTTRNYSK